MDDASQWLSVVETAARLGRSTEQVRRYLREGRLTGRRIGGQWFIAAAALDGFERPARGAASFLDRLPAAARRDPLGAVIGIGRAGGDIAAGKDRYRASIRRRP
ncbi:MAG TPA: helix-turn-helix domain-containing protein [Thermomicrobiales bacterium]|nr:helix-turn-helix domain-containing protein [Thermomicrobiales bacterium]